MKLKYLLLIIIFVFAVPVLPAQDLISAVKNGDIKQVERILSYVNIKEAEMDKDENNCNAYHWTAILGFKNIAELLIEKGFNPDYLVTDVPSKDLGKGLILYAGDITGAPDAAVLAEVNGNGNLVDFYLSKGNLDKHLRTAIMCDNPVVAEQALKAGANPNMGVNMAGEKILAQAVKLSLDSGSDELVNLLIKYGADISAAFASSFIYGTIEEDGEVWERLLDKGARMDQEYHDGNYKTTPLSFAAKKDREKLEFLIQHGAEPPYK